MNVDTTLPHKVDKVTTRSSAEDSDGFEFTDGKFADVFCRSVADKIDCT